MKKQSSTEFDFEDWAGLYLENPEEFEARRKAVLMIEMTCGTASQSDASRTLLDSYEKRVKGLDAQQRMQVSATMLVDSLQQLQTEMMVLKHTLEDVKISEAENSEL